MARDNTVKGLFLLLQVLLVSHREPVLAVSDTESGNPPRNYEGCLQGCFNNTDVSCVGYGLTTIPDTLECKKAMILDLKRNRIKQLPTGVFSGFRELVILLLSGNEIVDIPLGVFSDLENLQSLYIDKNNLTSLREGVFRNLTNLHNRLLLTANQITEITTGVFETLSLVKTLAIEENRITSIQAGAFRGMNSLVNLVLKKNVISRIASETFSGLGTLEVLDLSENRIEALDSDAFSELSNLKQLKLNSNRITSVAPIVGMPQLNRLTLADNEIQSVGDNLFLLRRLEKRDITVTFEQNPLSCNCSTESLRLWYKNHESTVEEQATCRAPEDYAGRALVNIPSPLPCDQPSMSVSTKDPSNNARSPNALLDTSTSIVITIVTVGLITLILCVYVVMRRHRRKMRQKAENDYEKENQTADGYSTFVSGNAEETRNTLMGSNTHTEPYPVPNVNGHIFQDTEPREKSSFLPVTGQYLHVEELNHPSESSFDANKPQPAPKAPTFMTPPPPVSPVSSVSSVSPVSSLSLQPDVVCSLNVDERGETVITLGPMFTEDDESDPFEQPPVEDICAKLGPRYYRGYIAPHNLVECRT